MTQTTMAGGWSQFRFELSESDRDVFNGAMHGLVGVGYKPLAVATQVVAGLNYCFLCKAHPVYPKAEEYAAEVYIYAPPPPAAPHISEIKLLVP
ncbi:hypothetical protein [Rubrivivax gelatinosus]|uniref:Uncharacterized protein n=1 Tax=Rubrivivax gelatinosus (strain NBRC 100245 / IL144) TaxID=983917 RepID=I0HP49_RUBGI|nr:hypothetical protein [Rubrivivax gelatinosus]MBG6081394.1 hypothetical protein [Rubrivivax gelatinosus]BAL94786.1 hypothetical protein RGE_14450 [Rubrivivax gelatinosus IL144]